MIAEINGTTEGEELKIIKYDELKMERPQRKAKKEKRNNPKHQDHHPGSPARRSDPAAGHDL